MCEQCNKLRAELSDCQYWHGQLDEKHEALKAENQRLTERVEKLEDRLGLAQDLLYEFGRMDCMEGMDSNSYCGKCAFCRAHDLWEMIAAFLSEVGAEQALQHKECFEWTCPRCGAKLPSTEEHCPCEFEVQHKEEE